MTNDFDLRALFSALDAERRSRGLTWSALAAEVNRSRPRLRPIAPSTIASLEHRRVAEGDGILQMLLWLDRTPESFVPAVADADAPQFRLPHVKRGQILRWDTRALFAALDARRKHHALTWAAVAREAGGCTPGMLANLAKGPRIGFPRVMRLVGWLGEPAVTFIRTASW